MPAHTMGRIAADTITAYTPVAFSATANKVTATTVSATLPAGIPQDSYVAGQVVDLTVAGIIKVKVSTASGVSNGSPLMVGGTAGQVVVGVVKSWCFGIALQTPAADGDVINCLYSPHYYAKDAA